MCEQRNMDDPYNEQKCDFFHILNIIAHNWLMAKYKIVMMDSKLFVQQVYSYLIIAVMDMLFRSLFSYYKPDILSED